MRHGQIVAPRHKKGVAAMAAQTSEPEGRAEAETGNVAAEATTEEGKQQKPTAPDPTQSRPSSDPC